MKATHAVCRPRQQKRKVKRCANLKHAQKSPPHAEIISLYKYSLSSVAETKISQEQDI